MVNLTRALKQKSLAQQEDLNVRFTLSNDKDVTVIK